MSSVFASASRGHNHWTHKLNAHIDHLQIILILTFYENCIGMIDRKTILIWNGGNSTFITQRDHDIVLSIWQRMTKKRWYLVIWWMLSNEFPNDNHRAYAWWRHQMETFSALLAICAGNSSVPGEFPTHRPVTRALMFSLICVWINGWVNNREAGDLRRYRGHYDVIVMGLALMRRHCDDMSAKLYTWSTIRLISLKKGTVPIDSFEGEGLVKSKPYCLMYVAWPCGERPEPSISLMECWWYGGWYGELIMDIDNTNNLWLCHWPSLTVHIMGQYCYERTNPPRQRNQRVADSEQLRPWLLNRCNVLR